MKARIVPILLFVGLTGLLSLLLPACGNACKELADKICDCQPTRSGRDSCQISVNAANRNTNLSSAEQDACQAILDSGSCTCEALLADDAAACGLANDAQTIWE